MSIQTRYMHDLVKVLRNKNSSALSSIVILIPEFPTVIKISFYYSWINLPVGILLNFFRKFSC